MSLAKTMHLLPLALPLLLAGCTSLTGSSQAFWAVGQEPFWQISVKESLLVLRTPDQPDGQAFTVSHQALDDGMRWQGRGQDGLDVRFEVRAQPCRDVMSGVLFTHTAVWQSGSRQATGCAVSGTQAPSWRDGEAP